MEGFYLKISTSSLSGFHTLVWAAPQPWEVAPTAVVCSAYIKCLSAAQTCQSCTSTSQKSRAITLLAAEQNIFMPPLTYTSSLGCGSRWMGTSSNLTPDTLITYQNAIPRRWTISSGEGFKMLVHNQQHDPQVLLGFNENLRGVSVFIMLTCVIGHWSCNRNTTINEETWRRKNLLKINSNQAFCSI